MTLFQEIILPERLHGRMVLLRTMVSKNLFMTKARGLNEDKELQAEMSGGIYDE